MGNPAYPYPPKRPAPPKLGRMDDIAAFKAGVWNGRTFDDAFVSKLHQNFQKFSAGPSPFYRPYISIDHKDNAATKAFRFGELTNSSVKGGTIHFDAANIPEDVGEWLRLGLLREPSVEFIEPVRDRAGNVVDGFRGPDGKVVDGPVIKCLTFLGNDIPGVKGLPPLPPVKFHHFGGRVSRFGSTKMDRAAIIQFLSQWGVDTSGFSDTDPSDAVLQAFMTAIQAKNQNPNPAGGGNGPPDADAAADIQRMADSLAASMGGGNPAGGGMPTPSQVVMKFVHQTLGQVVTRANATLSEIQAKSAAVNAATNAQLEAVRADRISTFFDRMGKSGQITPAMQPAIRRQLGKCDMVKVSKFSHDATKSGSELDAAMDEIAATYPVIRDFGKGGGVTQPNPANPPTRGNTGAGGNLTPERRRAILAGSPQGQAVLDKQRQTAGNN